MNGIGERQGLLDRLRGFALLGVVVVNAPFLLTSSAGLGQESILSTADRAAALVTWVVFQGKAYLVFAFLFGYSLTIFLAAASAKGLNPIRLYLRRLAALFVLGVLHATLLFPGDILVVYGVMGLLLVALRRRSDRSLLVWAGVFFALQALLLLVIALLPVDDEAARRSAGLDARLATGNLADTTGAHLALWPEYLVLMILLQGALVAAMFCVGLYAGRHGVLRAVDPHRAAWLRARRWGLGLGLPTQAIAGWLALRPGAAEDELYLGLVVQYLTAPVLSTGLVAAVVLLPRRGLARMVEADGRMSLTIYLAESLALTVLAVGWGFGAMGLGPALTFSAACGVWVGLLACAWAWHHLGLGPGPAERVLRRLTYGAARGAVRRDDSSTCRVGENSGQAEASPRA